MKLIGSKEKGKIMKVKISYTTDRDMILNEAEFIFRKKYREFKDIFFETNVPNLMNEKRIEINVAHLKFLHKEISDLSETIEEIVNIMNGYENLKQKSDLLLQQIAEEQDENSNKTL